MRSNQVADDGARQLPMDCDILVVIGIELHATLLEQDSAVVLVGVKTVARKVSLHRQPPVSVVLALASFD